MIVLMKAWRKKILMIKMSYSIDKKFQTHRIQLQTLVGDKIRMVITSDEPEPSWLEP